MRSTEKPKTVNRPDRKTAAGLLAVLILAASALYIGSGLHARYVSEFKQAVQLIIHPTVPVLAENGEWYRGSVDRGEIKSVTVVGHDYEPPEIGGQAGYEERFNADVRDKGTIRAYITRDADGNRHLILSGNGYNGGDSFFANADSSEMFSGFSSATEFRGMEKLDFSGSYTEGTYAVDLSEAFKGCTKAITISGTENWDTGKVTDMSELFSGCTALPAANVSGWNTANVTDMSEMFAGCGTIGEADLSSFAFTQTETMKDMFSGCASLYSIAMPSPEHVDTEKVKDLSGMFRGTAELTGVSIDGFDTENVEDMSEMFRDSGIQSLDLRGWDTGSVRNMDGMFSGCTDLVSVTVTQEFSVPEGHTDGMFTGCESIVGEHGTTYSSSHLDGEYARIDTTNTPGYFCGETLRISFDGNGGSGRKEAQYVLAGEEDTIIPYEDEFTGTHSIFGGWTLTEGGTEADYEDGGSITIEEDTTLYVFWIPDTATFMPGNTFNTAIKRLGGATSPTTDTRNNSITAFTQSSTPPEGELDVDYILVSDERSNRPIYAWLDGTVVYYYTPAETVRLGNACYMFKQMKKLESIDCSAWDTSKTGDFSYMFIGCESLNSADMSGWNTSAARNMVCMFSETNFATLDLSSFDTSNVNKMNGLFSGCKAGYINLSGFDTSKVDNLSYMFDRCINLTELNLTNFNTANVTNMGSMFSGCSALTTIYAKNTNFVTSQVTNSENMFSGCTVLTGGTGSTLAIVQGEGVTAEDSYTKTYAREDHGAGERGYFTGDVQTITYHINDGTETDDTYTQNVPRDVDNALTPNRFSREGYTFTGWGLDASDTTPAYDYDPETEDIGNIINLGEGENPDLYAIWKENIYSITYELNEGSWAYLPEGITEVEYLEGNLTYASRGQYIDTGYKPSQNTFGYVADFTFFDNLSNSTIMSVHTAAGTDPSFGMSGNIRGCIGGHFANFIYGGACIGPCVTAGERGTVSLVHNNDFDGEKSTITVTSPLYNNAAEEIVGSQSINYDLVVFGSNQSGQINNFAHTRFYSLQILECAEPVRDYIPAVWNGTGNVTYSQNGITRTGTLSEGTAGFYDRVNGIFYINSGSGTFTAGPTISVTTRRYTESVALPGTAAVKRTGYTFGGWYESSSCTGTALTEIAAYTASDKTVYAKWEEDTYAVLYRGAVPAGFTEVEYLEGNISNATAGQYIDTGYKPNQSTFGYIADYVFYNDLNGVRTVMSVHTSDITKPCFGLTGNYQDNYGGHYSNFIYKSSDVKGPCTTPGEHGTVSIINNGDYDGEKSTITVTSPRYNATETVTGSQSIDINLFVFACDINGAATEFAHTRFYSLQLLEKSRPVRDYIPVVWNGGSVRYSKKGTEQTGELPAGTAGFYDQITGLFYINSGSGAFTPGPAVGSGNFVSGYTPDTERTYTETVTFPTRANVSRTGYIFGGWYDNAEYTGEAVTSVPSGTDENRTVYAGWVPVSYTVQFNSNGGQYADARYFEPITVAYDEYFTIPELNGAYAKPGYVFVGYDTDQTAQTPAFYPGDRVRNLSSTGGGLVTLYCIWSYNVAVLDTGANINAKLASIAGGKENITAFERSVTPPSGETVLISLPESSGKVYAWYDSGSGTVYWYTPAGHVYLNRNCSCMFAGLENVTHIDMDGLQTVNDMNPPYLAEYSTVTDISYMFDGCRKLEAFPTEDWSYRNITNVAGMYKNCTSAAEINTGAMADMQATDLSELFNGCSGLEYLDLRGWNTEGRTGSNMLSGCTGLHKFTADENFTLADTLPSSMTWYNTHQEEVDPAEYYTAKKGSIYSAIPYITYATFDTGSNFNTVIKTLAGNAGAMPQNDDTRITSIARSKTEPTGAYTVVSITAPEGTEHPEFYDHDIKAWFNGGTLYYYSDADVLLTNADAFRMFNHLNSCKTIGFDGVDTWQTTNTGAMFGNCKALTSVDVSDFDTTNVTNMHFMFGNCFVLTDLDVSTFNTENAEDMSNMFEECRKLADINISGFRTSSVENMSYMFSGCTALTAIDVSSFNTANVTNMSYMFNGCSKLISLDLTAWNENGSTTGNVENMNNMFNGCYGLTSLNFANFNTAKVTDMSYMFQNVGLTGMIDLSAWDVRKVTTMRNMFCYGKFEKIDISGWQTESLTNTSNMFYDSSNLSEIIGIEDLDTADCTNIYATFANCNKLVSLDLSKWDTSKVALVTHMQDGYGVFDDCSGLTTLKLPANLITSKVNNLRYMFSNCSSLTTLDLSDWDTSAVTDMSYMFNGCTALTTIYASASFVTAGITDPASGVGMFTGDNALVGGNGTPYSPSWTEQTRARIDLPGQEGYFTVPAGTLGVFMPGAQFNTQVKKLSGIDNAQYIRKSATAPAANVQTVPVSVAGDIVAWVSGDTLWWYSYTASPAFNADCSGMFAGLSDLTTFDFTAFFESADSSAVTDISGMFEGDTALATVNFLGFEPGTLDMTGLFKDCTALKRLNFFSVDFSGATVTDMFDGVSLSQVSNVPAELAADIEAMGTWYTMTSHVKPETDTTDWTGYTTQLSSGVEIGTAPVTANGKITSYPADLHEGTFYDHANVSYAAMGNGGAINVAMKTLAGVADAKTDTKDESITAVLRSMNAPAASVTTSDISTAGDSSVLAWFEDGVIWYYTENDGIGFKNSSGTTAASSGYQTFREFTGLELLDCSGWNTFGGNNQGWYGMVYHCIMLSALDTSSFDSSWVNTMWGMFFSCTHLSPLDVSGFDASRVTIMESTFNGCKSLTDLELSHWNTAACTSTKYMFNNCTGLTTLDLTGWSNPKVTNMSYMFNGCTNLQTLDLTNFNTAACTDMRDMFNECAKLHILDVSNFNTAKVTDMRTMFHDCSSLASIDVSGFTTPACTNMDYMFQNCTSLTSLDCSGWENTATTTMKYMFSGCTALESVDLAGFGTAKVTDMQYMFYNCKVLPELNLVSFDTAKVTNMSYMFRYDANLRTIYVSPSFVNTAVSTSTNMFANCSNKLKGGEGTIWSSANITKTYARIDRAVSEGVPGYFTLVEATFKSGNSFNSTIVDLAGGAANITDIRRSSIPAPSGTTTQSVSMGGDIVAWYDSGVIYWYTDATVSHMNTDCSGMFVDLTSLERFNWDGAFGGVDQSPMTDISGMFAGDSALETVHIELMDTSNVTDMSNLFADTAITRLSLFNVDTSAVTNASGMFPATLSTVTLGKEVSPLVQAELSALHNSWFSTITHLKSAGDTSDWKGYTSQFDFGVIVGASPASAGSGMTCYFAADLSDGTFYDHPNVTYAMLGEGATINRAFKTLASQANGGAAITNEKTDDNYVLAVLRSNTPAPGGAATKTISSGGTAITAWYSGGTVWYYTTADEIAFRQDSVSSSGFRLFRSLCSMRYADVSGWNTLGWDGHRIEVTFGYDYALRAVDLSSFDTTNTSTLYYLFAGGNAIEKLDVSGFDTAKATTMSYMFSECNIVKELDVSHFNTAKVTTMSYMFNYSNAVEALDVSGFNTSKVTNTSYMFFNCNAVRALDVSGFDMTKVTNVYGMFQGCSKITTLDFSEWNKDGKTTKNIQSFGHFVQSCKALQSVDLTGFDTSGATRFDQFFNGCNALRSVDLSSFNTSKVTNMNYMFQNCQALTSLDITNFDTSNVTDMSYMFRNCSKLTELDLSAFDTSKVGTSSGLSIDNESMQAMFSGCSKLTTIYASPSFDVSNSKASADMFLNCYVLVGGAGTAYSSSHVDASYAHIDGGTADPGYFTGLGDVTFKSGSDFAAALASLGNVKELRRSDSMPPQGVTIVNLAQTGIARAWLDAETGIAYWYTAAENVALPADCSGMFAGLTSLEKFVFGTTFRGVDASAVTEIHNMFDGDTNLSTIVLNDLDTAGVTDMSGMFKNCTVLKTLHFELCDTSHVTNMSEMFSGCGIGRLNLFNVNTSAVTNASDMFSGCTDLSVITLDKVVGADVKTELLSLGKTWYSMVEHDKSSDPTNDDWRGYTRQLSTGVAVSSNELYGGTFYDHADVSYATLEKGSTANIAIKNKVSQITGGPAVTSSSSYDYNVTAFLRSNTPGPATAIQIQQSGTPITAWYDNGTVWYYTDADEIAFSDSTDSGCVLFFRFSNKKYADVSGWNTLGGNNQDISSMFNANLLTALDVSSFDVRNVSNFQAVFANMEHLKSLDVSGFVTSCATNMMYMFSSCYAVDALDVVHFDTAKVTNMSYMCYDCKAVTTLDVSHFNTALVTTMASMFSGCTNLQTLDVSNFNTANVTTMESMFYGCSSLTELDVSSFNTSNVTSMRDMFHGCSGLTSLDLSNFDTSSVNTMYDMFMTCSSLTELDLSSFDTGNVTTMLCMFWSCTNLTSLDVSGWDTSEVQTMYQMFYKCSKLTVLDLSSWNTAKLLNTESMFNLDGCLTTIYVSDSFVTTGITNSIAMFNNCGKLAGQNGTHYDANHVDKYYARIDRAGVPGYFTARENTFKSGSSFNSMIKGEFGAENIKNFVHSPAAPAAGADTVSLSQNAGDIIGWLQNGVLYWYSEAETVTLPASCANMFADTGISGINFEAAFEGVDQSAVTNISGMFRDCEDLERVNFCGFAMENVTNTSGMFDGCTSLSSVALGDESYTGTTLNDTVREEIWNSKTTWYTMTDHVEAESTLMTEPDATGWRGYVRQRAEGREAEYDEFTVGTFYDHSDVVYATLAHGTLVMNDIVSTATDKSNVKAFLRSNTLPADFVQTDSNTISDSGSAQPIYIWFENGNLWYYAAADEIAFLSNSPNSSGAHPFRGLAMRYADVSGWNTLGYNGKNAFTLFCDCTSLLTVDVTSFDTSRVTDMSYMFNGCNVLAALDVSGWDTASATNMNCMFSGCSGLTTLDVTHWNTSSVTDMRGMFNGCAALASLDLSDWNENGSTTANVKNMQGMFSGCSGLTTLDLTGFRTNACTTMGQMFYNCQELTTLDASSFNISVCTTMSSMFRDCFGLTSLDASGWNENGSTTANVQDMSGMFWNCTALTELDVSNFNTSACTSMSMMFRACSSLTNLDLSGWNNNGSSTANIKTMNEMFRGCSGLTSLDLTGFKTTACTTMASMFSGCSALSSLDVSGWQNDACTTMASMFSGCSALSSLDVSGWNNAVCTDMSSMFNNCSALQTLDLTDFKTNMCTKMDTMFYYCRAMTALDLSSFNTSNVTHMNGMFKGCLAMTSLNVSSFNTSNVMYMPDMFNGCKALTTLDLSNFNTAAVTNMNWIFEGDSGLTSIDISSFDTSEVKGMECVFNGCSALTTIYASEDFVTTAVTNSTNMFNRCTALVGQNGTTYDSGNVDAVYARIDEAGYPGYFTGNAVYAIGYYNYAHEPDTSMFLPDAVYPTERRLSQTLVLPGEDMLLVPEGKYLDGWLEYGEIIVEGQPMTGWKETPVYEIAEGERGALELTPNWVPYGTITYTYEGTEWDGDIFLPEAEYPVVYRGDTLLTLPTEEVLIVPEGKVLDGWLCRVESEVIPEAENEPEQTSAGCWSGEPVYSVGGETGIRGNITLTPNWSDGMLTKPRSAEDKDAGEEPGNDSGEEKTAEMPVEVAEIETGQNGPETDPGDITVEEVEEIPDDSVPENGPEFPQGSAAGFTPEQKEVTGNGGQQRKKRTAGVRSRVLNSYGPD